MKKLIMIITVMITGVGYSQKLPKFLNRSEKRFVQNVIDIQGDKPIDITKRKDDHIVLEFTDAMYVLKPDGYIGEMWILEDADWLRLPSEEESY